MSAIVKTQWFAWERGEFEQIDYLKFPTTLALSDADADVGTVKIGKGMGYAANSLVNMKYADPDGNFCGFLCVAVNKDGTTSVQGQLDYIRGSTNIPNKRGAICSLRVPLPRGEIVVEGPPATAVGYNNMIVTSGTGALAANTTLWTELTMEKGAWRIAQPGEFVYGLLQQANLTPVTATNIRCRIQLVSMYKKYILPVSDPWA
jgi:hypothetical protein